MKRRLNWKFLLILLGGSAALVVSVFVVHRLQVRRAATYLLTIADKEEKADQLDKAIDALDRYVSFRPNDLDAMARFGRLLAKAAKNPTQKYRAAQVLENVARRDPERIADVREAAELLTSIGLHRLARPHWETLLARDKSDGVIEGKLALADVDQAQYESADRRFTTAIKASPKEIDLYLNQTALLKSHLKSPQRAVGVIDAMVVANGDQARAFVERARFRLNANLPGADSDLAVARKLKPDDLDLALLSARIAARDGSTANATKILTDALALHPQSATVYLALGQTLQQAGKSAEAIETLRKGAEKCPDSNELRFVLIDTLIESGKPAEAEPLLADFRTKSPNSSAVGYLDASLPFGQKHWAESIRKFEKILPDLASAPALERSALFHVGQAYERIAAPELALSTYRRALALSPEWTAGRVRIAALLGSLGRIDDAIRDYRALPIGTPGVRQPLMALRIMQNARRPEADRQWTDIEAMIADAERTGANPVEALGLKIDLLLARGKIDEARTLVEKARKDLPDQLAPTIYLAYLLEAEKKSDDALKVLDEAKAKFGDKAQLHRALIRFWGNRGGADAEKNLAALGSDLSKFGPVDQSELLDSLSIANLRIGNRAGSAELLDASIRQAPENVRLRIRQLDFALESGGEDAIKEAISQLRRLEGEDGIYWRIGETNRLLLAVSKSKSKQGLGEARTLLESILKRQPDSAEAHRLLGHVEDIEGNKDLAIAEYQRSMKGGPVQRQSVVRLASLLVERGRFVDANKLIVAAEASSPALFDDKKVEAEVAVRAGDFARGETLVAKAVAADSKNLTELLWLSRMLSTLKKPKEAEETARRAITLAPKDADARLVLILDLLQTGDRPKAVAEASKAEAELPRDKPVDLARIASAVGNYTLAATRLDEALAAHPDDLNLLQESARLAVLANQSAKSIALFRKILNPALAAPAPVVAEARRGLAQSLLASGRIKAIEEAETLIDRNLQDNPDSSVDLRLKPLILAAIPGRRKDALRAFEKARASQSLTVDETLRLAQLLDADGQWSSARQQIVTVLGSKPMPVRPALWFIGRLLQRKDLDEAGIWLAKLEDVDPKSLDLASLKSVWLHAKGRNPEAVALLDARLKTSPEIAPILARIYESIGEPATAARVLREYAQSGKEPIRSLLLAQSLARQGKLAEALDLCDAAWALCPPDLCAATSMTIATSAAARSDPAVRARLVKAIEAAIVKYPKATILANTLAQILLMDARFKDAEPVYLRILETAPDDPGTANNYAWMLAFIPGRETDAATQIQKAIDVEGPLPQFLDTRGLVRLAQGQVQPAIADFERSIAGNPGDVATVHFHLALALLAAENRTGAMLELRAAEALGFKPEFLHQIEIPSYDRLRDALGLSK